MVIRMFWSSITGVNYEVAPLMVGLMITVCNFTSSPREFPYSKTASRKIRIDCQTAIDDAGRLSEFAKVIWIRKAELKIPGKGICHASQPHLFEID